MQYNFQDNVLNTFSLDQTTLSKDQGQSRNADCEFIKCFAWNEQPTNTDPISYNTITQHHDLHPTHDQLLYKTVAKTEQKLFCRF